MVDDKSLKTVFHSHGILTEAKLLLEKYLCNMRSGLGKVTGFQAALEAELGGIGV